MSEQPRRLYRSKSNKVITGVCGGIAEYLNADATIIRIVVLLMTFFGGSGLILYVIAFFIMPEQTEVSGTPPSPRPSAPAFALGGILIAVGVLLLLDNLDLISFRHWWHLGWDFALPAALILAGVFVLTRKMSTEGTPGGTDGAESSRERIVAEPRGEDAGRPRQLRRSVRDKKILGICGGLGEFFGMDPTLVRLLYVAFTLLTGGAGVVLYLLLFLIVPEEPESVRA
jgi:phage shock protein PspC (stress-responsive transcriptional regulator)